MGNSMDPYHPYQPGFIARTLGIMQVLVEFMYLDLLLITYLLELKGSHCFLCGVLDQYFMHDYTVNQNLYCAPKWQYLYCQPKWQYLYCAPKWQYLYCQSKWQYLCCAPKWQCNCNWMEEVAWVLLCTNQKVSMTLSRC